MASPRPAPRALIVGLAAHELSAAEREYLSRVEPWGVILFGRNVDTAEQVRILTSQIRMALGRADAPILVDQEGGRVQRLGPPNWPSYPSAGDIGRLYRRDPAAGLAASRLASRLIAHDLHSVGISVSCLPVLDLRLDTTHGVIGDRAYSDDPQAVGELGGAAARGLLEGGCLPVMKHVPGHGRAECDSHFELPVVTDGESTLRTTDFVPFRRLNALKMAMTAHIRYQALDAERPATLSPLIISKVIRGEIGFDGLLMSDDLSMNALSGTIAERARQCVDAGCDVALHCNGEMDEMASLVEAVPPLEGASLRRAGEALGSLRRPVRIDAARAMAELEGLMTGVMRGQRGDGAS